MATTNTIDASLSTSPSQRGDNRLLSRFATRKVGNDGVEERVTLLPVEEVLYFFTAGALSPRPTIMDAKWREWKLFSSGRVYVRTAKGLFVTRYRTLGRILARLDPEKFLRIDRSLAVNVLKIVDVDLVPKLKQVGVSASGSTERLTVSRRALKNLLLVV